MPERQDHPAYRALGRRHLVDELRRRGLPADHVEEIAVAARVVPWRLNRYVIDELIDWDLAPEDPIFRLTVPSRATVPGELFERLREELRDGGSEEAARGLVDVARGEMNPHPGGQTDLNVPTLEGRPLPGLQHKYRETVLFFPPAGQTCHAYCTYCFRWPQFVTGGGMRFGGASPDDLVRYLRRHPEVSDVLLTGGDPLVMRTKALERIVEPLLRIDTLDTVRFGTKAPAWWPYRFLSDPDADDLLRLLERIPRAGKHAAVMVHYTHPRELSTPAAERALSRIRSTGAEVRCQCPLVRGVNDDPTVLAELWRRQVALGAVPYYLFVARPTGPRDAFAVPLARAVRIHRAATASVSGLARTARGPVMSATPGKVLVSGTVDVDGTAALVLRFLQARDPEWVGSLMLARAEPGARWLDELRPLSGDRFFFDEPMAAMASGDWLPPWMHSDGGRDGSRSMEEVG